MKNQVELTNSLFPKDRVALNKKYMCRIPQNDEIEKHRVSLSIPSKKSNLYIPLALLGGLISSIGQVIRGYESENAIASNFMFGSLWILLPSAIIIYSRVTMGKTFRLPWVFEENNHFKSLKIFLLLLAGGILEFLGTQFLMFSFKYG